MPETWWPAAVLDFHQGQAAAAQSGKVRREEERKSKALASGGFFSFRAFSWAHNMTSHSQTL